MDLRAMDATVLLRGLARSVERLVVLTEQVEEELHRRAPGYRHLQATRTRQAAVTLRLVRDAVSEALTTWYRPASRMVADSSLADRQESEGSGPPC